MTPKERKKIVNILEETGKEINKCVQEGEAAARRFDKIYNNMMRAFNS